VTDGSDSHTPLTRAQAVHFRKLRRVIFGTAVLIFGFMLWYSIVSGEISGMLRGPGLSKMDSTGRTTALTLCVLAGLVFAWIASGNIAKLLSRRISQ